MTGYKTMQLSAPHVANYFLSKAEADGCSLCMLKLMKMVYIAQGWSLAILDRDILCEDVQAWKYGPVIPSLYHEFKHFAANPIDVMASFFTLSIDDQEKVSTNLRYPTISESETELALILDEIWSLYKDHTGGHLVNLTHMANTPWSKAIAGKEDQKGVVISPNTIKEYYKDKLSDTNFSFDLDKMKNAVENQDFIPVPKLSSFGEFDTWLAS